VADEGTGRRAAVNLTDLADRYGSDKGSAKHRYTELYHMLFHPYRNRTIRLLEMGLQIGGPEHGAAAERKTTDLPSIRMWLEFFPRARVHGLDVSDFSWFAADRFTFHRCDMDAREDLARTAADLPDFDIILDDASHASHHQQNAFLELFPKLRRGGLYIIEDLRWQPEAYERPGITKTAELFRSFSEHRAFRHADPGTEAEFAALAPAISGCFLFPVRYERARRDQVAVIHKR
jgi:SAM-dependent methyltransferase